MRPQDLIAAFDTLAEAPNGVTRLRELVLHLAVRGKLVPQDPADEPASVLLERIAEEKARLVKEGKIRSPKPLPPVSEEEMPFEVPKGWMWSRLGAIAIVIRGVTYGKAQASESAESDHIALLRAHNIQSEIELSRLVYVPRELVKPDQFLRVGDVLFCIASGSAHLLGKSARITEEFDATFGAFTAVVRLFDTDTSRFFTAFSDSPPGRGLLIGYGQGIGINNLKTSDLARLHVPIPPLSEQNRIVAKVDELMGLLDCLEAGRHTREETRAALRDAALAALQDADTPEEVEVAWERITDRMDDLFTDPADMDPLRQTVLQLAVRGRLVPQDPADEPASILLERIAEEKAGLVAEKKIRKPKPSPPVSEEEVLFEVPEGWVWTRLGTIVEGMKNGLYKPTKHRSSEGVAYLRMYNIQDGRLDWTRVQRLNVKSEEMEQFAVKVEDILLSRVNSAELVGKAALVRELNEPTVFEAMTIRVRLVEPSMASFVNEFLRTSLARAYFMASAKHAIGQSSINQPQVAELMVPLPPLSEQHRIVAKVDELMGLLDGLEERLFSMTAVHDAFATAAAHHLDA